MQVQAPDPPAGPIAVAQWFHACQNTPSPGYRVKTHPYPVCIVWSAISICNRSIGCCQLNWAHHARGYGWNHNYWPLTGYVKLRVVHAPGMLGMFSPPPRDSGPNMHHGTCMTHMPGCMPGSLTSGFLQSRWRGKRSWHSRCMRNP